jgi:hypothetical protein
MTRQGMITAFGLGLGGIVLAASPLWAQYGPIQPGPCASPIKFKPIIVYKSPTPMPPAETNVKPSVAKVENPPELPYASGPLPPPPPSAPKAPASEPDDLPKMNDLPPFAIPKGFYPSAAKKQPQVPSNETPPEEPPIQPIGNKVEIKKTSSVKPEVTEEIKRDPPPLEIVPELPPNAPSPKPAPKADIPELVEPPLGQDNGQKQPIKPDPTFDPAPLEPIKPAKPQVQPLDFEVPAGKHTSPWVIKVEVIKTVTHLIASSKNVQFHVQCQNLKVQSPGGDIQAEGDIKITAGGLDLNCEKLTISWQNDWVLLEGKVRLQTQKDGQQLELTGDKLQLKLTTMKLTTYYGPGPIPEAIVPAKQAGPSPVAPVGNSSPQLKSFYQRVTQDE